MVCRNHFFVILLYSRFIDKVLLNWRQRYSKKWWNHLFNAQIFSEINWRGNIQVECHLVHGWSSTNWIAKLPHQIVKIRIDKLVKGCRKWDVFIKFTTAFYDVPHKFQAIQSFWDWNVRELIAKSMCWHQQSSSLCFGAVVYIKTVKKSP